MDKLEAIRELEEWDHAILMPEYAAKIAGVFGLTPRVAVFQDSRSQFKGITLGGDMIPDQSRAAGVAAHVLAEQIADSYGLEYSHCSGIGSRLRAACGAVIGHLS